MKILYITNARIPTERAHGKQIMKMCESFTGAGAEVELVLPQRHNADFRQVDPFGYYGVQRNFQIKYLSCIDWLRLRPLLWRFAFRLQRAGFNKKALSFARSSNAAMIYTRDENLAFDLSESHKVYLELHYFSDSVARLIKESKEKIKGFVVITESLKQELAKQGVSEDKILVAADGVDLEEFGQAITKAEAREQLKLTMRGKICLYAGSLQAWKGVQTLARAGEYLGEDFEVIILGGWPDHAEKFRQGLNIDSEARVKVIAYQPPTRIPLYLKAADVLVLPNSGQIKASKFFHTSPLKLFEYMSAGRPIVASDLPVIREILNDDLAVLVEPDNPESLARGIKHAAETGDSLAENAFEEVKKYTWESRVSKIINFIKARN
jgi:glycosyltransferase involved in cell wall biosynthesis